ncbi:hypothetical protein ESCO_006293 [Escovopsis weberi]|uniref:Nuclear pore complex protein Nup85 n=1 Tax=Escovopsis weberi TaxID=150374 RepID=A0A0M8N5G5_ESCWE|nr:hypothetical protein ESCO_006293 [Escovopsis weberi]
MAHRFLVPDSSPVAGSPATPGKRDTRSFGFSVNSEYSDYDDSVSMTPAGPPPSSGQLFPGAGASTNPFLGDSIMATFDTQPFNASSASKKGPGRSLFGRSDGLSKQFNVDQEDEDETGDAESEAATPPIRGSVFRRGTGTPKPRTDLDEEDYSLDIDAEVERYIDEEMDADDGDQMEEEMSEEDLSEEGDLFLNMRHDDRPYGQPVIGEGRDLMMMNTPAATARVKKEAERIYKRSVNLGASARKHSLQFGAVAKDMYAQQEPARLSESSELILMTENLVCKLYDDGVGMQEDPEKLQSSLADITFQLIKVWTDYVDQLPPPEGEDLASIGPSPSAEPFEKAAYVAHLILRMHHTRFESQMDLDQTPPLPEILFDWMQTSHNLYRDQIKQILQYKPSPACHSLYWETLRNTLLRGDANGAKTLLRDAGWEQVRKGGARGGDKAYSGKALENVRRFVDATCEMLEQCPATKNDWDVYNSSWTLFRVQARGSFDRLTLFAEGRDTSLLDSIDDQAESMSSMARKASSQIPWDIYENLQTIYGIVLGNPEAILEIAQDWCEATIGLFGWLDEGAKGLRGGFSMPTQSLRFGASTAPFGSEDSDDYFERLVTAFHQVVDSGLRPNTMNPVEIAIASAFEGNINALIGCLRTWSLPVASSVAEIASLGRWLPKAEPAQSKSSDGLDLDDLMLLGLPRSTDDETEGIKDSTLVVYARELAGIEQLSPQLDGWEMAIQVLGRMDASDKADETVGELLRDLLATLDENSSATVDKMWRILSDLGMMNYAEETAESFAEILSQKSHRYGEALWYFALSHRTDRVREVLNLLMSYSLLQSTVYPVESELDDGLKSLLRNRTETLEERAKQDLEAAQLLGYMLSGYATLRKFYELRDEIKDETSPGRVLALKKQAAFALVAVVSSSGDNIRGGLYDETRNAVVSEDFLLALLGEATAFVSQSPSVISLEQIDILLKAIEDIQTVGARVSETCEEFFGLVLSAGQGLKGSTPLDLMRSTNLGASFMMSGSTMLVSRMQKSMAAGGKITRGWDWRKGWNANTKGEDVLRKLRLGLAKDLAVLWLEDADGVATY